MPINFSPTFRPTEVPTKASFGYFQSGAGVIITALLFGLTIFGSIIVCIRRCYLLRNLEREHAARYRLEMELENAPEVAAQPYMDIDYAIVDIIDGDELQSNSPDDFIPPAEKLKPLFAENVEPFHENPSRV